MNRCVSFWRARLSAMSSDLRDAVTPLLRQAIPGTLHVAGSKDSECSALLKTWKNAADDVDMRCFTESA
jgi:hypothetical protein